MADPIPTFPVTVQPGRSVQGADDQTYLPGQTLTLPGDQALSMIASGFVAFAQAPGGYNAAQLVFLAAPTSSPPPAAPAQSTAAAALAAGGAPFTTTGAA